MPNDCAWRQQERCTNDCCRSQERIVPLVISTGDRRLLAKRARSRTLPARVVMRSRIVLMLADGAGVQSIANALHVAGGTVRLWKRRFEEQGPYGLVQDAPGRGRKPALDLEVRRTLRQGSPADGQSLRQRARELGVSASTISRWRRRKST
jgi:transposase